MTQRPASSMGLIGRRRNQNEQVVPRAGSRISDVYERHGSVLNSKKILSFFEVAPIKESELYKIKEQSNGPYQTMQLRNFSTGRGSKLTSLPESKLT